MTSNHELLNIIDKLKIRNFKGIVMKDQFNQLGDHWDTEYGIYNLEDSNENGSHWCSWIHKNKEWFHFCPYGADPPKEFIEYIGKEPVMSSTFQIQEFGTSICGHLCVLLIYLIDQDVEFEDAVVAML